MDPLTPLAFWGRSAPYATRRPEFWLDTVVMPVRSKSGLAVSRLGSVAHRVAAVGAIFRDGECRFGARWACGGGSTEVVPLPDADAHGGVCERCDSALVPVVYHCFDADDRLIYIGSTGDQLKRFSIHRTQTPWWPTVARFETEAFPTITAARAAEWLAIKAENPVHNRVGRNRVGRSRADAA